MAIEDINRRIYNFTRENYPEKAEKLVYGCGISHKPRIMMAGEAPGAHEEEEGKPFVGKAGENLTEFLQAVDISRDEIYITNTVKIRPVKVSEKGTVSNRPPTREEIAGFLPFFMQEICEIEPEMIVTLGNVPLNAVLSMSENAICPKKSTVGVLHGQLLTLTICGRNFRLFPLYHPASVIYNRKLKDVCLEDYTCLRKIMTIQP